MNNEEQEPGERKGMAAPMSAPAPQDPPTALARDPCQTALQESPLLQSTLDALPAHIAVLDETGRIAAVNAAWRRFADSSGLTLSEYGVGTNYLDTCDRASGPWSEGARAAARIIREVLAGRREESSLEYPCVGPAEQLWFMMRVKACTVRGPFRLIVMHENITERKYAESALQELRKELKQTMAERSAELMRANGRVQAEASERSRMQNLLTKISGCFLQFATDARENINRLTTLCGEVMSADGALYNRLDGGMLIAWGQWNAPAGYNPASEPEGRICYDLIKKGVERLYICNLQESEYAETEPVARDYEFRTYLGRPVRLGDTFVGNLCVVYRDDYVPNDMEKELMGTIATAIAVEEKRGDAEAALRSALSEVEELKNRLQAENTYLQEEIRLEHNFDEIVTQSDTLRRMLRKAEQVASTDATVLILGETGTGKELLARAIHTLSRRRERALVKVNCAALPPTLIESELFGHEKGAFTGAFSRKIGRFELADTGTIFLDEVGDLPLDLQAKILRVLQEGEMERVGGTRPIKVDVRVIAATHRNLGEAIKRGAFREDLYYRLNVFPLTLPPLRERREDIPLLATHFARKHGTLLGKRIDRIPRRIMDGLQGYDWPGNVRELENVIERAVILSQGSALQLDEVFELLRRRETTPAPPATLREAERQHIERILRETSGKIEGNGGAALRLGLKPSTLRSRMKKLGIERP